MRPVTIDNVHLGMKVVRGPDWHYGEQDGGKGGIGKIILRKPDSSEVYSKSVDSYWARVQWENGDTNAYQIGNETYTLAVYENLTDILSNLDSILDQQQN